MWARLCLVLGLLWPGILAADDWQAFDTPGAFAVMRHALAPGTGDPAGFDVADCATQRNLDARGRAQAARIGAAFRDRDIAFDRVLSSQWCRCLDTARLLDLGPVEEVPALNSFFGNFSARERRTEAALARLDAAEGRVFVVSHQVNIRALTGRTTRSGEVLVVRRRAEGLEVLGSVLLDP
ncbi:histidine phosphatase family protein [Pseudoponticoccus marisrubri]|uniref:Histidine phosphatase family protein n=1 Tax=Pseudoponticoccus marisrubri TaxID=1685382 RepID=A0A0W7WKP7_9RHOB|nr:histidine phosphatase family protein [Pseudoponticoccus marisrubri]KUF11170.1 histidine phosphatase family protein [Pseudoponticoccus marisrubri]